MPLSNSKNNPNENMIGMIKKLGVSSIFRKAA